MFYVVGNGPSLTQDMVGKLPAGRWLGMNSAFKFWHRIGKFPRYYACLDPVVVKSQSAGIRALLAASPIEKYFLHESVLGSLPELAQDARVTLLSDFLKDENLSLPVSPLSRLKQTTGALAARFAIEQGEKELMLLGIDCNYVDVIEEAARGAGVDLEVKREVKSNPNYFFDDYQGVGDKYQIPNPPVHSGNLHLQSFVCLQNDLNAAKSDVSICVGSAASLLHKYGIFPLRGYWSAIGRRRLQCVAVPLTAGEVDGFLENLGLWLDPRLKPSLGMRQRGTNLHLFFDFAQNEGVVGRLDAFLAEHAELYSYFDAVKFTFFAFPDEANYYIRNKELAPDRFCTKSGPNLFFLSVMAHCSDYEFTLQMESDCLPLRAGWLDAADNLLTAGGEDAWISGPGYFGPTRLNSSYRLHINGNAIYNTGCRQFQEFLTGDFAALMRELIAHGLNDLAYDTVLSLAFANLRLLSPERQQSLLKLLPKFRHSNFMLNAGGSVENSTAFAGSIGDLLKAHPDSFLAHGRWVAGALGRNLPKLDLYFNSSPQVLNGELPFSHFWANCSGFDVLQYEGYGAALVSGRPANPDSNVVLHFLRLDAAALGDRMLHFNARLQGSVALISQVELLVVARDRKPHRLEGEIKLSVNGAAAELSVRAKGASAPEGMTTVGLRIAFAAGAAPNDEVRLAFADISCREVRLEKPATRGINVEMPKSTVAQVIDAWCEFLRQGERRGRE